ncbi:MAG TPA: hypothetical protein VJO54_00755 [Burkholderiales bacterium]|nr:hypothetical protein [Burkholderiales bacterium]
MLSSQSPSRAILFGALAALSACAAAADQSENLSRLREEAAQQRQTLEATESRIRALEQNGENASGGHAGAQPGSADDASRTQMSLARLKKNWSQVEPGTPRERVHALLGAPDKVLRIDGSLVWYYVYPGIGPASVFFSGSGKVSSRQSPSFGWW